MLSILAQCIWFIGLEVTGRIDLYGKRVLRSWKYIEHQNNDDRKYMNKFRKGCRPLAWGVEGVWVVKRLSVLKFLMAVVKGTFRAILALKTQ